MSSAALKSLTTPSPELTALTEPTDDMLVDLILRRAKQVVDDRRRQRAAQKA